MPSNMTGSSFELRCLRHQFGPTTLGLADEAMKMDLRPRGRRQSVLVEGKGGPVFKTHFYATFKGIRTLGGSASDNPSKEL